MPNLISHMLILNRAVKVSIQLIIDSAIISVCLVIAIMISFENIGFLSVPQFWQLAALGVLVTLIEFSILGLYSSLIRYISPKVLFILAQGSLISSLSIWGISVLVEFELPQAVFVIYGFLVISLIGGVRYIVRKIFLRPYRVSERSVIIYGAGEAGIQTLNSLSHSREFKPIAFIDDNSDLQKLSVGGLKVHNPSKVAKLVKKTNATLILLAMPSIGLSHRREIIRSLVDLKIEIKTIPGMSDIISGKSKISEFETISPDELLGREPVPGDLEMMRESITGKVVMVTGAGGSIGSEICRQVLKFQPKSLVIFEVSEFSLYQIENELYDLTDNVRIYSIMGSIQNSKLLKRVIERFQVQSVYHAAAYKHVPLVEENIIEGVRNNIFGTLAIATVAMDTDVESFTLISTDKAVRPTNVMGATKRVAELICQAQAQRNHSTVYSMVRFGNVLGSSGSVIPKFQRQIERGGPVTVTHRDMTRYFMTISEAAQLVIQASALAKGGEVFVLDMGQPVKILDLAMDMIKMHGLFPDLSNSTNVKSPNGDIQVLITGLRKGEKLYEELLIDANSSETRHERIMIASEAYVEHEKLSYSLDQLRSACDAYDVPRVLEILIALPLYYSPQGSNFSDL